MKAVMLKAAGGPENFEVMDIEQPTIKANEVLVETKGISLNPADIICKSSDEMLGMMFGAERPILLGWDLSGIVKEVGSNVSKFKVGDRVFGMINFPGQGKTYAEYVAAPESHLAKIPDNTNFIDAAATTLAALTAYQMLKGNVSKGDRVLVQGGSGGVGHFGIQLAKSMGAYVITTASADNKDFVMSLGADEHINYKTQSFEDAQNIDYVLDIFGGERLLKAIQLVKKGGKVFSTAAPAGPMSEEPMKLANEIGVEFSGILVQSRGDDMQVLADMLADGSLKANVYATFPLEEMAQAHTEAAKGNAVGKLVVTA